MEDISKQYMMRVYPEVGSKQPYRYLPRRQLCMHLFLLLLIVLVPPISAECAAVHPRCICTGKNIQCEELGNVTQVPAFRVTSTTYNSLTLRWTSALKTIQANAFSGLKVNSISFIQNGLTRVDPQAFSGLGNVLRHLGISFETNLKTLPDGVFDTISQSLVSLWLERNSLTSVSSSLFSHLTQLQWLELVGNRLTTIPDNAFNALGQLRTLTINLVGMSWRPALLNHLTSLTTLDIGDSQLEAIPDDAFKEFTQLTRLCLESVGMLTWRPTLNKHLIHLRTLILRKNGLTTIPGDAFFELNQLIDLQLGQNRLKSLSPQLFSQLTRLIRLGLCGNQISTIIPEHFANLTRLEELYLYDNNISTLNPAQFSRLTHLRKLYLNGNHISTFSSALFNHLTNLEILDIGYNQITTLSPALFNSMTNLDRLGLSGNQISTLSHDVFSKLTKLSALYLENNRLKTVSPDLFSRLIHLSSLGIYHNPFHCDCHLAWIRSSKLRKSVIFTPVCASPPNVYGDSIMSYVVSPCDPSTSKVITSQQTTSAITKGVSTTTSVIHLTTDITTDSKTSTNGRTTATTINNDKDKTVSTTTSVIHLTTDITTDSKTSTNGRTTATTINNDKDKTEHYALIAVGVVSGLLTVVLVVVFLRTRIKCVLRRSVQTVDNQYSHTQPENRAVASPIYETILATRRPVYVTRSALEMHESTHVPYVQQNPQYVRRSEFIRH